MGITIKVSTKTKCFNLLKQTVIYAGIFCILLMPFLKGIRSKYLHGDEVFWLNSSIYFKLLFIDKDIGDSRWKAVRAYDQPPVGKYIIGLILYIAGYGDKIDTLGKVGKWHFHKNYNWNMNYAVKGLKEIPLKEILYVVRLTLAIIGSFACLLLYWIGKKLFGIKAGLIAAFLLAYNPIMLSWSTRVMTDGLLLFFLISNVALIVVFYSSFLERKLLKTFIFAGMIGVNIALAAGTKLNGGLAAAVFFIFCMLIVIIKTMQLKFHEAISDYNNNIDKVKIYKEIKVVLISLLIAVTIVVSIFVAMNPYLYNHPLKGIIFMIRHRMQESHSQQRYYYMSAITSLREKFYFIAGINLFPVGSKFFILKWGRLLILPVGLIKLLCSEVKYYLRGRKLSVRSIIFIWFFISFIGIIFWIPMGWGRYYLPLVPCEAMILGYIIDKIIGKCWRMVK